MREWTINFLNDREPLVVKGDTLNEAIETYLQTNKDLSYAILSYADLRYANLRSAKLSHADLNSADLRDTSLNYADLNFADLRNADLRNANLAFTDLRNANMDYSCLPLYCGSLKIQIDKRIACQLLYHTLKAMESVADEEVREVLNDDKVLALANQFHRADQCGKIVKEK